MEITLRHEKSELLIDHIDGVIGFTVLDGDKQLDFSTDKKGWERLKRFIDDDIYDYEREIELSLKSE